MEIHPRNQSREELLESAAQPFRLCVLFDSEEAAREADIAAGRLLEDLGAEVLSEKHYWNITTLGYSGTRAESISDAARADVILLSLSSNGTCPALKSWGAEWLRKRSMEQGGLLAIIPGSETVGDWDDLVGYFRETAVSANMDFLCRSQHQRFTLPG